MTAELAAQVALIAELESAGAASVYRVTEDSVRRALDAGHTGAEITALLPQLLTDAAAGNYQGMFALAFAADLPKGAMSEGMFLSVVCSEDMPHISPDDIARETAGRFVGGLRGGGRGVHRGTSGAVSGSQCSEITP